MNSPSDINSRNATPAGGQDESINSSPVHGPRPARIEGWPKVAGYCPGCGTASLFLGSGGWVTCSRDKCPNPTAVADLIEHRPDLSVPAPQPNPSNTPKVTVTGIDGVTRIVQGVEAELPDGVEYTFGPCETCGEMICEHERVSQPVVSSSRAVDLDLDQIEARANAATAARAEAERLRADWEDADAKRITAEWKASEAVAEADRVREALQAAREFVGWLTAMGQPTNEALKTRRAVTLGDIICGARAALRALDAALGSHPDESENPTKEMDHA